MITGFTAPAAGVTDPRFSGVLLQNGAPVGGRTLAFFFNGTSNADGYATTDLNGAFTYTPSGHNTGENDIVIKMLAPVYGTENFTEAPVAGYAEADNATITFYEDPALTLGELRLANPTSTDPLEAIDPTIEGEITGNVEDAALQLIEFDYNGDGVADGSTLTDGLGGFEFTAEGIGAHKIAMTDLVSARARLVTTTTDSEGSAIAGTARAYRVLGDWTDPLEWKVISKPAPAFASLRLEHDTGHYGLGYEVLDGVTSDPTLVGRVADTNGSPVAFATVEFDHNGDGQVDGYASAGQDGRFRYEPEGLTLGYWDLRARVTQEDPVTEDAQSTGWVSVTRSGDPSDTGQGVGFTLVAADVLVVSSVNWASLQTHDPTVGGQVDWVLIGGAAGPGAEGAVVDFYDQYGFHLGSTTTDGLGAFTFTPIGLTFSLDNFNDADPVIEARPRQSSNADAATLTSVESGNGTSSSTVGNKAFNANTSLTVNSPSTALSDFATVLISGDLGIFNSSQMSPLYVEMRVGRPHPVNSADGFVETTSLSARPNESGSVEHEFEFELDLAAFRALSPGDQDVRIRAVGYDANGYVFGAWKFVSISGNPPTLAIVPDGADPSLAGLTPNATPSVDLTVTGQLQSNTAANNFNGAPVTWEYEVEYDFNDDGFADEVYAVDGPNGAFTHTLEGPEPGEFGFKARVVGYGTFTDSDDQEQTLRAEGGWAEALVTFENPAPELTVDALPGPVTDPTITGIVTSEIRSASGLTVEVDEDGDGYADGTTVVLADGTFEYTLRDDSFGEHILLVRAVDPYSDAEPLEGDWESFTLTVVPHDPPPVDLLDLEGYVAFGVGGKKTADPVIVGRVNFSTLPGASLRWVEFDHDGDGATDGAATVDATGAFRYSAEALAYGDVTITARSVAQVGDQRVVGEWSDEYNTPLPLGFLHEPSDLPEVTGELTVTDATRGVITGRVTTAGFGVAARVQVSVMNGASEVLNGTVFANASGRFEYELLELGSGSTGSQQYTIRVRGLVADPNAPLLPAAPSLVAGYYAGAEREVVFTYAPVTVTTPEVDGATLDLAYVTNPGSSATSDPTVKGRLDLANHGGVAPPQTYVELTYGYADPVTLQPIVRAIPLRGDGSFEYTPDVYDDPSLSFDARVKRWDPAANSGAGGYVYGSQTESTPVYTLSQAANTAPSVATLKLHYNKAGEGQLPSSGDPAFSGTVANDGRLGGMAVYFDHNGDGLADGQTVTKRDGSFFYRAEGLEPSDTLTQTMTAWVVEEDYWGEEWASAAVRQDFLLTRSPLIDQLTRSGSVVSGTVYTTADPADVWVEYEVLGGGVTEVPADLTAYLQLSGGRGFKHVTSGAFSLDLTSQSLSGPVTVVVRGVDTSGVTAAFTNPSEIDDEIAYQAEAITGPWRVLNFVAAAGDQTLITGFGMVEDTGQAAGVGDIYTTNPTIKGTAQPYQVVEITTERYNDDPNNLGWVHVATERTTANSKGGFEFASGALVAGGPKYRVTAAAVYFDPQSNSETNGTGYTTEEFYYVANDATLSISGDTGGLLTGTVTAGPEGRVNGLRVEIDVAQTGGLAFDETPDAFAITDGNGAFTVQLYGLQPGVATQVRARVIEWDPAAGAFTKPDFEDDLIPAVAHATFTTDASYNGDPGLADHVTDDLAGLEQADATVREAIALSLADTALAGLSAGAGAISIGSGSAPVLGLGGARSAGVDADEPLIPLSILDAFDPATFSTLDADGSGQVTLGGVARGFTYEVAQAFSASGEDATLTTSIDITLAGLVLGDADTGLSGEEVELGELTYSFEFYLEGSIDEYSFTVDWNTYWFHEDIRYDFIWRRVERLTEEDAPYLTETVAGTYDLNYNHEYQQLGTQSDRLFNYTETIHIESWREETDPSPPAGSTFSRSEHSVYDEVTTNTGAYTGSSATGTLTTTASGRYDSEVNTSYSTHEEYADGYDTSQDYVTQAAFYEGTLDATINYVTGASVDGEFDLNETFVSGLIQSGGGSYARGDDSGGWNYEAEGSATTTSTLAGSFVETSSVDTLDAVLTSSTNAGIEGSGSGSSSYYSNADSDGDDQNGSDNYDQGTISTSYTFGLATSASLKATITASGDDYDVVGKLGVSASTSLTDSATVNGDSLTTTGDAASGQVVTSVNYGARVESSSAASLGVNSDFGYGSAGGSSAKGDFYASAYGSVTTASQAYGTTVDSTGEEELTLPFRDNEVATASLSFAAAGVFSAVVQPGQADSRSSEGKAQRLESATVRTTSYAGLAGPAEALALGDGSAAGGDVEASLENFTLIKSYATSRDEEAYDFYDLNGAQSRFGSFGSDQNASVETITQIVASGSEEEGQPELDWGYRYRSDAQATSSATTEGSFAEPNGGQRTATAAIDEVFTTLSREESAYRASGSSSVNTSGETSDTKWKLRSSLFAEVTSDSTSSGMVTLAGDDVATSAFDVVFTSEGRTRASDRSSSSTTGTLTTSDGDTEFQTSARSSSRARLSTTSESSGVVSNGAPGRIDVRATQSASLRADSNFDSEEKTTGEGLSEESSTTVVSKSQARQHGVSEGYVDSSVPDGLTSNGGVFVERPSSFFNVSSNSSGRSETTSTWKTSYDYSSGDPSSGGGYSRGSSEGERVDTSDASDSANLQVTTGGDGRRREEGVFSQQSTAAVKINGDYTQDARSGGATTNRSGPIRVDQSRTTTAEGTLTSDHGQTTLDVSSDSNTKTGDRDLTDKYRWIKVNKPASQGGGPVDGGAGSDTTPQDGEIIIRDETQNLRDGFAKPTIVTNDLERLHNRKEGLTTYKFTRTNNDSSKTKEDEESGKVTEVVVNLWGENIDEKTPQPEYIHEQGGVTKVTAFNQSTTTGLSTSQFTAEGDQRKLKIYSIELSYSEQGSDTTFDWESPTDDVFTHRRDRVASSYGSNQLITHYKSDHTDRDGRAVGGNFTTSTSQLTENGYHAVFTEDRAARDGFHSPYSSGGPDDPIEHSKMRAVSRSGKSTEKHANETGQYDDTEAGAREQSASYEVTTTTKDFGWSDRRPKNFAATPWDNRFYTYLDSSLEHSEGVDEHEAKSSEVSFYEVNLVGDYTPERDDSTLTERRWHEEKVEVVGSATASFFDHHEDYQYRIYEETGAPEKSHESESSRGYFSLDGADGSYSIKKEDRLIVIPDHSDDPPVYIFEGRNNYSFSAEKQGEGEEGKDSIKVFGPGANPGGIDYQPQTNFLDAFSPGNVSPTVYSPYSISDLIDPTDINGDGVSDFDDYLVWKNSTGGLTGSASNGHIPLPNGLPADPSGAVPTMPVGPSLPTIGAMSPDLIAAQEREEAQLSQDQKTTLSKLNLFLGLALQRRKGYLLSEENEAKYHQLGAELGLDSKAKRDYFTNHFNSLDIASAISAVEEYVRRHDPAGFGSHSYKLLEAAIDVLDDISRAQQQRHINNEEFDRDYGRNSASANFGQPLRSQTSTEIVEETQRRIEAEINRTLQQQRARVNAPPRRPQRR